MIPLHKHILASLVITLILSNVLTAQAKCVPYAPAVVTLTGQLESKTYPGRPNYYSIAEGDEPETGFYLAVSSPICAADEVTSPKGPRKPKHWPETNIPLVQLVLDQQGYAELRPYIGKSIRVKGTLFEWISAHHHTPLLLDYEGLSE